jgi:hypothetical protein
MACTASMHTTDPPLCTPAPHRNPPPPTTTTHSHMPPHQHPPHTHTHASTTPQNSPSPCQFHRVQFSILQKAGIATPDHPDKGSTACTICVRRGGGDPPPSHTPILPRCVCHTVAQGPPPPNTKKKPAQRQPPCQVYWMQVAGSTRGQQMGQAKCTQ